MPVGCATCFPVPRSDGCLRVFCGIVNMIVPGLGLLVLALNYRRYRPTFVERYGWISLMQFLLAFVGVGWVWAVFNGLVMLVVGCTHGDKEFGPAVEVEPDRGVRVVQ